MEPYLNIASEERGQLKPMPRLLQAPQDASPAPLVVTPAPLVVTPALSVAPLKQPCYFQSTLAIVKPKSGLYIIM